MLVGGDGSRDGAQRSAGVGRPSGSPAEDEEPHLAPSDGDSLFVGMGAICDTAARLTGADGAAVAVLASSGEVRELVHATDALAQQIDELQFTLGEGPCLDAYRRNEAQLCAELDDREYAQRWPLFTAESVALGAAAGSFEVAGQLHPMGVLELYRRTVGPLAAAELESAQVCATAIRVALEANWHGPTAITHSVIIRGS